MNQRQKEIYDFLWATTKETGEQEVSKTIETTEITETDFTDKGQSELSELEKQIEEFEKGTSDETTITQDILRVNGE